VISAEERAFLKALKEAPGDAATLLAYADWLEEHDRPYRAMMQRVRAGVSQGRYKLRRKSDGLFAQGRPGRVKWSAQGKEWDKLTSLRAHLGVASPHETYGGTPWEDVEIAVYEVRVQFVQALAVSLEGEIRPYGQQRKVNVAEPE
jgi:uncharacterized protein (TIGR02996 family)